MDDWSEDYITVKEMVQELWDTGMTKDLRWIKYFGHEVPTLEEITRGKNWIIAQRLDEDPTLTPFGYSIPVLLGIFPLPKHALNFLESDLIPGGYAPKLPGGVAAIEYEAYEKPHFGKEPFVYLNHIQCLFKTGESVNRSLASIYGGARHQLLKTMFDDAKNRDIFVVKHMPYIRDSMYKKTLFTSVAEEQGFTEFSQEPSGMLVVKKP